MFNEYLQTIKIEKIILPIPIKNSQYMKLNPI